jgi:Spy/CpxP family protein refolding chaperone/Ni/Co efflux regulator RcnB
MKRIKIIVTIILMAFVAANSSLNAQRGQGGFMRDSVRMNRTDTTMMNRMRMNRGQASEKNRMYGMEHMRNFPGWRGFPQYGPMGRGHEFYRQGPGRRWMNPLQPAPFHRGADSAFIGRMPGPFAGRGSFIQERIPGLTDSQKARLEELRDKNQAEMKRFRDETAASMRKMREQHREKMLEILNPEQKKWLESRMPVPAPK